MITIYLNKNIESSVFFLMIYGALSDTVSKSDNRN